MDVKTLLAPFVGVASAWLLSKGVALTPDQIAAVTALAAGGLTALAHFFHSKQATPPHA